MYVNVIARCWHNWNDIQAKKQIMKNRISVEHQRESPHKNVFFSVLFIWWLLKREQNKNKRKINQECNAKCNINAIAASYIITFRSNNFQSKLVMSVLGFVFFFNSVWLVGIFFYSFVNEHKLLMTGIWLIYVIVIQQQSKYIYREKLELDYLIIWRAKKNKNSQRDTAGEWILGELDG